jgi:RNA polymerase sigma-70 factor (ECF subfamily)
MEFDELLRRARAGDRAAMESLVQQYEREVRIVARVRLGAALRPYLDSLDLVQSVHRSLMLGLRQDKFDISTPERLVALALTIVRRKLARQWRRLRRQKRLNEGQNSSDSLTDLLVLLSSPESGPESIATFRDQTERWLSEMTDVERRVMELRLDGYTTAEVARQLGMDADVLRVRLSRLRRRLREQGLLSDYL